MSWKFVSSRSVIPQKTMRFLAVIATACLWLTLSAPAHAQLWTWTNEYGSTLAVNNFDSNTGAITGTFTNQAAGSCDLALPQAMSGWLVQTSAGTAIGFSVNFVSCGSTTVWTGQLNSSTFGFQALWLLSLAEPIVWNGISAGTDTFTLTSGDNTKLFKH